MYYYKQIDESGNTVSVLSCDQPLTKNETQIEILRDEYDQYISNMPEPEPEPEPPDYVISSDQIAAAYAEGVQEA